MSTACAGATMCNRWLGLLRVAKRNTSSSVHLRLAARNAVDLFPNGVIPEMAIGPRLVPYQQDRPAAAAAAAALQTGMADALVQTREPLPDRPCFFSRQCIEAALRHESSSTIDGLLRRALPDPAVGVVRLPATVTCPVLAKKKRTGKHKRMTPNERKRQVKRLLKSMLTSHIPSKP
ncbi:Uncharacterized protein PBTT_07276 [Plasmodiophora brassicae]|uniref:Uncharacterized protein n=1 Tax=Plasmodiophora brassicae TaxID=37360 RepID=A0A0G4J7X5_PLABS|nr:hypothetical protein PBRA_009379 [Plasmodiophora brassicae]SPQ99501.1 unnamed protein product [Plasmodiophora brassicae]